MKALLIIDMQLGSFRPYTARHDTMDLIERLNSLSGCFRAKGHIVIYIQHDGSKEHCFVPGADDWKILQELVVLPQDLVISKTANDSFYKTELQEVLDKNNITELFFAGCATDFCVDATVKSAHAKDYKVTVVADGHTTASRPFIDAPSVIQYYNWLWADMTPTTYGVSVITAAGVVDNL